MSITHENAFAVFTFTGFSSNNIPGVVAVIMSRSLLEFSILF